MQSPLLTEVLLYVPRYLLMTETCREQSLENTPCWACFLRSSPLLCVLCAWPLWSIRFYIEMGGFQPSNKLNVEKVGWSQALCQRVVSKGFPCISTNTSPLQHRQSLFSASRMHCRWSVSTEATRHSAVHMEAVAFVFKPLWLTVFFSFVLRHQILQ